MSSVYKNPEEYLLAALQRLRDVGSKITDFTAGSAARTFNEGLAAQLSLQSQVAEQLRTDSYLSTATGEALDRLTANYEVKRKAAVPAVGTVRLTRTTSGTAVSVAAGWGPLLTAPTPGQVPVAIVTTEDAIFDTSDTEVVVAAAAVEGGVQGNLPDGTRLLPQNPVGGFDTDGGFETAAAFTGGIDEEPDDQLRARVPLEVQGRAKGTKPAFLAAALRVPGVTSASVLEAGDTREPPGSGLVAVGDVEIYYVGAAGLQAQVESEAQVARVAGQNVTVDAAGPVNVIADLTVFCLPGTDTGLLATRVKNALMAVVNRTGVDAKAYAATAVRAVHDVTDVISVNVPFTDFRKSTDADGTFGDLDFGNTVYPVLTEANVTVTVTEL